MRKAMSKKKRTIMTVTGIALMIPGFIIAVKNFYFVISMQWLAGLLLFAIGAVLFGYGTAIAYLFMSAKYSDEGKDPEKEFAGDPDYAEYKKSYDHFIDSIDAESREDPTFIVGEKKFKKKDGSVWVKRIYANGTKVVFPVAYEKPAGNQDNGQ